MKPPLLNPRRQNGAQLSPSEVQAIADTYATLRSENATAKALGIARNTVRLYLHRGDPARGIAPLLASIPPAPAPAVTPDPAAAVPDDLAVAPAVQVAPVVPPVPASVRPRPAPVVPVPAPAPGAPVSALPAPVPGIGAVLPAQARPAAPAQPADPVQAIQHTVTVANNELVRLSRNTRGLYDLRQRVLTRMVQGMNQKIQAGETPKLSKAEREMAMLLREARIRPIELLALHRVEVGILGVGDQANAADNINPTDETKTIEDLQAELKGLLAERSNLLVDDGAGPTTMNRPQGDD